MINFQDYLQQTLDTLLYKDGIYSFWQKKQEVTGLEVNQNEFIVYTLILNAQQSYADNKANVLQNTATVRYYYNENYLLSVEKMDIVFNREKSILDAMSKAGFTTVTGFSEVGDVDGIGFYVAVCEFVLSEVAQNG